MIAQKDIPDISESPNLTSTIIQQENIKQLKSDLKSELEEQYLNYNNLGFNVFNNYHSYNLDISDIISDLLEHIDEHLFKITFLENIRTSNQRLINAGLLIYDFIFVELITSFIPQINLIKNISDMDYIDFRDILISLVVNKIDIFEELYEVTKSIEISKNISKYSTILELINNDLENFFEKYVLIVNNH